MVFALLALFGGMSLARLQVDLLPDISFPTLTIVTIYENTAPQEIETLVTKPIEEIVSSVQGVDRVSSESIEGVSIVTVRFGWGTDMDEASIQTREKVDLVKGSLPQDVQRSIVLRFDPNDAPVMQLAVEPRGLRLQEMRSFLKKNVLPRLERVDGVAAVSVSGGYERQILIQVDRGRLDAFGIGLDRILQQVAANNFNFPAGNIERGDKEILVRTIGEFDRPEGFEEVVVGVTEGGVPVYLNDIAQVRDDFKERTSVSFYGSGPAAPETPGRSARARDGAAEVTALVLKKEAGKNTVQVAENLREAIADLNEKFSEELRFNVVSDRSIFIRESVSNVAQSAMLAGVICYFVLLFFLGSFREPFLVVTAIPFSILIALLLMYIQGITLNTMSLGGLAVGVGMVVDSASVSLESIYARRRVDPDLFRSALEGVREVGGSIFASTLTSIVVFLPVVFVEGLAGAVFGELALTIAYALFASMLVSLTLIPALSLLPAFQREPGADDAPGVRGASFTASGDEVPEVRAAPDNAPARGHRGLRFPGRIFRFVRARLGLLAQPALPLLKRFGKAALARRNTALEAIHSFYDRALRWTFPRRKRLYLYAGGALLLSVALFWFLPSELMPEADRGEYTIKLIAEEGSNLESTTRLARSIAEAAARYDGVREYFGKIGYEERDLTVNPRGDFGLNRGEILIRLESGELSEDAIESVRKDVELLAENADARVIFSPATSLIREIFAASESGVTIEVSGAETDRIREICREIADELRGIRGFVDVSTSFDEESPEYRIYLDRDRMAYFGISVQQAAASLRAAIRGQEATRYREGDEEIEVLVRLRASDRQGYESLRKLPIPSASGGLIRLDSFAEVRPGASPRKIMRSEGRRIGMVYANLKDMRQSTAMERIEPTLERYEDLTEYSVLPGEMSRQTQSSFAALGVAGLLAVVLVYMTLAAQFENYVMPVVVMLSIVATGLGAGLALLLFGQSINIVSLTGLVMLAGLVVNNALILIENFQQNSSSFADPEELVAAGVQRRLGPILNTTATTVLGLMPLALSLGGPSPQASMALAVVGGLSLSAFLTVLLIPNAYISVFFPDAARRRSAGGSAAQPNDEPQQTPLSPDYGPYQEPHPSNDAPNPEGAGP